MEVSTVFSAEEINQQAKRILNFPLFRHSPVLSRFLKFIIAETLDNRELYIKEYSIAISVLDRSRDFNPNVDAIVRIHAGRLRRALNEYYLIHGINDPVIIHIPKGCYIPQFEASSTGKINELRSAMSHKRGNKPVVGIFPFRTMLKCPDMEEFSLLLGEQISAELSGFRDVSVIGYYSTETTAKIEQNILEAGRSVGADYIITGSLTRIGQHIRVLVNLLLTATGEVLLCKSLDRNILPSDPSELQRNFFQSLIGFSGGCHEIIVPERQRRVA
jgi:TolB-like protein